MINLCIFDLDGTLGFTLETISNCLNRALQKYGFPEIETEKYKDFIGNGADLLVRRAAKYSAGIEDEKVIRQIHDYYDFCYASAPAKLSRPYENITETLKTLSSKKILLAVNSNKPDDMTKAVTAALFPKTDFLSILGQKAEIPKKPDPSGVFGIIETAGTQKENCVYIGDSETDIETAKNAGIKFIGAAWGYRGKEFLQKNGAVYIADFPEALPEIIFNF